MTKFKDKQLTRALSTFDQISYRINQPCFTIRYIKMQPLKQNIDRTNQISGLLVSKGKGNLSLYAQQYKNFEERLKSNKIKGKYASLMLRAKPKPIQSQNQENYLDLTKNIIKNKAKILFFEDKQNLGQQQRSYQQNMLYLIKAKIQQIKNPGMDFSKKMQTSQRLDSRGTNYSSNEIKSRVKSQSNTIISRSKGHRDQKLMTFLNYKRDKKCAALKLPC